MTRTTYAPDDFGSEVEAPSGYYQPLEEGSLHHDGRQVLYTLGSACIEASCCGQGSWSYARVEGYLVDGESWEPGAGESAQIDTVEDADERSAIAAQLLEKHPGVRVEFR